ncbi:hypothetical protein [Pectobacterium sp. B1J-3]|uniref:hypothetical protein n=1 Tax=Pectobacterium sp. B1J-3 TaxID=3385371 RepID=UPI0039061B3E
MNRGLVQQAFNAFLDRASCATVADINLFQHYLSELIAYIAELEQVYDPIDQWSVGELERVAEFLLHNQRWVAGADQIKAPLRQAYAAIEQHRIFLAEHVQVPDYLAEMPENVFTHHDGPST